MNAARYRDKILHPIMARPSTGNIAGPKSFSGKFRHIDTSRNYTVEGQIFYDEENQRIREFEMQEVGSDKMVYDKLKLYKLNQEYIVDLKTRKCNVTVPRREWRPYGVPPFAKYEGSGTLGGVGIANEQLTISIFSGTFDEDKFFVTVTEPNCFVTQMALFFKSSGFEEREFFDVVSGITDPQVFTPPQECL
ncbi:mammalian ependymin-related protein 1-like [Babylonia areolata]|uniref:mammalian ependymin-related protein 1-like n=1 Tax=Babylonia areolata TaxID=304850 RepID=UPI003FD65DA2